MSWFSRLRNWQTDQTNGIGIRSDYHDQEDNNFATGINECINYEGLNTPIANLPMGGFKFTGLANGTAVSDSATFGQIQTSVATYGVDASGTDSYAITLTPALSAYVAGQSFDFYAATTNTGTSSLNINALGAKTIKKDVNTDLANNDIKIGQINRVIYDGTNFQLASPTYGQLNQSCAAIYAADGGASDAYAITLPTVPIAYTNGMLINFMANTANTGAATINVNSLGVKSIVKEGSLALSDNDIKALQIVQVIYDGTNFQMLSPTSYLLGQSGSQIYAADAGSTDAYAITLVPAPTAYITGAFYNFKANTINTGAATLDVNGLGAKTIKKSYNSDLESSDILANQLVQVIYDGTNFQMLSPTPLSFDINGLTADTAADAAADFLASYDTGAGTNKKILIDQLPGRIRQVVAATKTDTFTTTSTSMTDLTGMSVSITPISTSSKVLVLAFVNGGASTATGFVQLVEAAAAVLIGDAASSRIRCTSVFMPNNSIGIDSNTIVYLSSPATTSAVTYKLQVKTDTGTLGINRSASDTDSASNGRTASSIYAIEIR
jgi:hypothetical protein